MQMYDLSEFRKNYSGKSLNIEQLPSYPVDLFAIWMEDAIKNEEGESNAVILSTCDKDLKPHSRVVLLKSFSEKGFVFFTNYKSNKGKQIEQNSNVALLFFWQKLQRQIRIEGKALKISEEESDRYFYSRPVESQWAAIASEQSHILEEKKILLERYEAIKKSSLVQRPKNWGGFLVVPEYFEFWQGQPNRLHDRVVYQENDDKSWKRHYLYP